MENLVKCPKCGQDLISEEFNAHHCKTPYLGIIELGVSFWYEGKLDKNGDKVIIAKGMDGLIYRWIHCTHNPPHPNLYPTSFDREKFRRRLDRAKNDKVFISNS